MKRIESLGLGILLLIATSAGATDVRDIVGVSHVSGTYTFSSWASGGNNDYLNEGANEIAATGTRVIKVWFHPDGMSFYPWTRPTSLYPGYDHTDAGTATRLVNLAATTPYATLFSNPAFTTYVLEILPNNSDNSASRFQDGMSAAEIDQEKTAMRNLAVYLLQTYGSTGKTFVLQNWEGDHLLDGDCCGQPPPANINTAVGGMIDWFNARQDGVTEARNLYPSATARVVHAAEVNNVWEAVQGTSAKTVVNDVLPYTHCDLYSYSCWDIGIDRDPDKLAQALDYIATKAPSSSLYGRANIYLGEYGSPEVADDGGDSTLSRERVRRMTEVALGWGCPYILFWEVFDNTDPAAGTPGGLWLKRPDGTRPDVYYYFQALLQQSIHRVALRVDNGNYTSADDAGGGLVHVNAPAVQAWEYLTILDRNGGSLVTNDSVNILTQHGNYFMAWPDGSQVDATSTHCGGTIVLTDTCSADAWELFTVTKQNGSGPIVDGDTMAIHALASNAWATAEGGGGGSNIMTANRSVVGVWEQFGVVFRP
ncbi:MAG TPA: hypothetical protein VHX14_16355 [Thermoanaerobaculia bacterium]|jgi:hypothetical protein|nr:hypothetical protein [Thermoanaerobaculia bacterium]